MSKLSSFRNSTAAYLIAALSWEKLTGGSLGIVGVPRPPFALRNSEFFLLAVGALGVTYAAVAHIARSPFGRVLGAIRDDETAARVFGKRTIAAKRACLAIAGATAGLAGVLTASFIQFLHPSMFWLPSLIAVLTAL
ncbi:MAG: branched-chain amino acid ABC transporter permease, partial [Candidatus Omnitrophica bacterium]|nr:branched-chain amino acid ABC transporter permease [Candidatus Omnitrophota bacterium]